MDGDWITIAVVAERGPIKYTNPPVGIAKEEEADEDGAPSASQGKGKDNIVRKNKSKPSDAPNPRRRYVNVKLIDFGSRKSSSSESKGHILGDAFLTLLLFEAEAVDLITEEYGKKLAHPRKVYRGGSGGAFEAMAKLKEGDVIALLNPRIMKPFTVHILLYDVFSTKSHSCLVFLEFVYIKPSSRPQYPRRYSDEC